MTISRIDIPPYGWISLRQWQSGVLPDRDAAQAYREWCNFKDDVWHSMLEDDAVAVGLHINYVDGRDYVAMWFPSIAASWKDFVWNVLRLMNSARYPEMYACELRIHHFSPEEEVTT